MNGLIKQKYPSVKKCPRCKRKTLQCKSFEKHHYTVHIKETGSPDITCTKKDKIWFIEAKGETANETVDFHTALGQMLRLMKGDLKINYAIALPDAPSYRKKCRKLSHWLRKDLHLYFILVEGQNIQRFSPDRDI